MVLYGTSVDKSGKLFLEKVIKQKYAQQMAATHEDIRPFQKSHKVHKLVPPCVEPINPIICGQNSMQQN